MQWDSPRETLGSMAPDRGDPRRNPAQEVRAYPWLIGKIWERMDEKGLNRTDLYDGLKKAAGVSRTTFFRVLAGKAGKTKILFMVCEALNIELPPVEDQDRWVEIFIRYYTVNKGAALDYMERLDSYVSSQQKAQGLAVRPSESPPRALR